MTFTPSTNAQQNPIPPREKGEPLDQIIQSLKAILPELRDRYGVISLGVFGSYVCGEQTPDSDLDLLVEFDPAVRLQFSQNSPDRSFQKTLWSRSQILQRDQKTHEPG
jgi:predicted nucleotidyltransferase